MGCVAGQQYPTRPEVLRGAFMHPVGPPSHKSRVNGRAQDSLERVGHPRGYRLGRKVSRFDVDEPPLSVVDARGHRRVRGVDTICEVTTTNGGPVELGCRGDDVVGPGRTRESDSQSATHYAVRTVGAP